MKCPGSVVLSYGVYDEDSEYSDLGTAAHVLASMCLVEGIDAWELTGHWVHAGRQVFSPDDPMVLGRHMGTTSVPFIQVDEDMADAVQDYLTAVRLAHPDRNEENFLVERRFHCPELHEHFYGTADTVYIEEALRHLHVWDYKHGAGIMIEVQWNEQTMYYACGVLTKLDLWDKIDRITLHIAQPRGFHADGPIREWTITTKELGDWLYDTLLPGMANAMVSRDTLVGAHCRFCPARRRACPAMMDNWTILKEFVDMLIKEPARKLTAEEQATFLDAYEVAKISQKAIAKDVFDQINGGGKVSGWKIVSARAFRKFKDGAQRALKKKFGDEMFEPQKIRSPAQIDLLPGGKAFTTRYAFKPPSGGTLVRADDTRTALSKATKSMFQPVAKKGKKK